MDRISALTVSATLAYVLLGACAGEGETPAQPAPETEASEPGTPAEASPIAAVAPELEAPTPAPTPVVRLGAGFTPDPWVLAGEAEGTVGAAGLDADCSGFIPSTPSVLFQADTAITELTLIAQGSEPGITLMVQGPDGDFRCVGEPAGEEVRLSGYFASGRHKIWLGTSTEHSHLRFRLGFSELPDVTTASVAAAALAGR